MNPFFWQKNVVDPEHVLSTNTYKIHIPVFHDESDVDVWAKSQMYIFFSERVNVD